MPFTIGTIIFSLFFGLAAVAVYWGTVHYPTFFQQLPRHRRLGAVMALAALYWSAFHIVLMLEGDLARFRNLVFLLPPIIAVLAYFFLQYLTSRALGGLLLLATTWLLQASFAARLPGRPLFSAMVYLIAAGAALLIATPWLGRDIMEKTTSQPAWRYRFSAILALLAIFFLLFALLPQTI